MTRTFRHTVTLPDGKVAKRVSQNRKYSHVVVALLRVGTYDYEATPLKFVTDGTTEWAAMSWSSTKALADKAAVGVAGRWSLRVIETRVLPVDAVVEHFAKSKADRAADKALVAGALAVLETSKA